MSSATPTSESTVCRSAAWDDETIRQLNRHMRIQFRYLSSAVRQMTLRQCMEEIPPSAGQQALISQVERKLSL